MDFWKSDYEAGDRTSVLASVQEFVNSPTLSNNSGELSSDSFTSDQTEGLSNKTLNPKTNALAKKRLEAYYTVIKTKQGNIKEEQTDNGPLEKLPKPSFSKTKKTVYPNDVAKAVVRDIELLKRAGFGYGPTAPSLALPPDIIVPNEPILPLEVVQLHGNSNVVPLASDMDDENLFKKREIKCKNIRKSDTYYRRSASPKRRDGEKSDSNRRTKTEYPKNWAEYKEMGLNTHKHSLLKSKLVIKSRDRRFDYRKNLNFDTPPVPIEKYKIEAKTGESVWIPYPYLKCTATKPLVLYSTNHRTTSPGFLSREQLFSLIPRERRPIIEKLWKSSRCETDSKPVTIRKWYPKNWKKFEKSEAKLLENSVGLSFLQSYSDEEEEILEDNNKEEVIEKIAEIIDEKIYTNCIEIRKEVESFDCEGDLFPRVEDLSPSATPKTVPNYLEIEKEPQKEADMPKITNWDDQSLDPNESSYYTRTPPIDDKEDGEVISEEDRLYREENLADTAIDEYQKTKEELEELEAVLKASSNYLPDVDIDVIEEIATKTEKKHKSKKKRKKPHDSKVSKSKASKKKAKKKIEKKEKDEASSSSEPSAPESAVHKKNKLKRKKKDAKTKKNKKPKTKKKKSKQKKDIEAESEEEIEDISSKTNTKKKKKKKPNEKAPKKSVSKDSKGKDRKNSVESNEEDYEDDIKFFAARFDAERKLKGKNKHKTKTNITLDDLDVEPESEEKIEKRKNKWETSEPVGPFSSETAPKKTEQKHKELFPKKTAIDEGSSQEIIKKDEIKVDLLKMNEDYLREQKRKEEKELSVVNEDVLTSLNETHQISRRNTSPSKEKAKEKSKPRNKFQKEVKITAEDSGDNIPNALIDLELEKSAKEINEEDLENRTLETSTLDEISQNIIFKNIEPHKMDHPDWQQVRGKRKRLISDSVQGKPDKKYKKDSTIEALHSETTEKITLKKERDLIVAGNERNSSWETDDEPDNRVNDISLDLEIPLNIKTFSRREIKIEKDEFNIEPPGLEPDTPLPEVISVAAEVVKDTQSNPKNNEEVEISDLEFEVQTNMKKRRWDIKSPASTPLLKSEKPDEIIDLDANSSNNCITLENEYEEFLKSLTSTKKDLCVSDDSKPILIDTSSDSSLTVVEDSKEKINILSDSPLNITSSINKVLPNFGELPSKPAIDVPTMQIPLPPVKSEPVKPVPVPSPKLEAVIDLNKPLINLSLSANVTQNITLSLATSVPSISGPTTTSIDISKPSFQISTPLSNETLVSMNNISFPFDKMSGISTGDAGVSDMKGSHIPSSSEFANIPVAADITPSFDQDTTNKLVFTSLTIPHKKLLDNSKLNLDDSDSNDEINAEELKRKKLQELMEDNQREALNEQPKHFSAIPAIELPVNIKSPINIPTFGKEGDPRKVSPYRTSSSDVRRIEPPPKPIRRNSPPSVKRRRDSSPRRRGVSPRRRSPPSRRRSPRRSPKRRSPMRRRKSLERRSISPSRRRLSSISPRRHRSPSPRRKRSPLPRRNRSPSPRGKRTTTSKDGRSEISSSNKKSGRKSPPVRLRETSPLKRSLADSTISDDQLPQMNSFDAAIPKEDMKNIVFTSPERPPLDVRINQVLGYDTREATPKPSTTPFYHDETPQVHPYYPAGEQYSKIESQVTTPTMRNVNNTPRTPQNTYRQVGNMLQILTSENLTDIPMPHQSDISPELTMKKHQPSRENKSTPPKRFESSPKPVEPLPKPVESLPKRVELSSKVLQVGNVLEIVPTEMVPTEMIPVPPPLYTEIKIERPEEPEIETPVFSPPEKHSAEATMLLKVAEMRAERETRRLERERRKKEKEKRRKEKEKARQAKLKVKTEDMIKRALELEEEEDAESDLLGESHAQWPPTPLIVTHSVFKDIGKSILVNNRSRLNESLTDERKSKNVQFADGIRPGEGTSPSAGEDFTSPPPPKKKLPKEKRFKKLKFGKKNSKKKVKVKIIKKPPSPLYESDSDDNLPPPSPPPGSPPPHIFPPRIKVNPVNNVPAAYLTTIIHNAQQHQQLQSQSQHQQQTQYQPSLYRPPISLIMAPPPPPQGHLPSVPPHAQSPHGAAMPPALSPQTHYHPTLTAPPPALAGPLPSLNEPPPTLNAPPHSLPIPPPPPPPPHLFGPNTLY